MKNPWWAAVLAAVLVLAAGCSNSGTSQNSTRIRALNAVVDAEQLDVLVDDDVKLAGVALGATTALAEFDSGEVDVKIRSATNATLLLEKTVSLSSGTISTLVMYGKRNAMGLLALGETGATPADGKFKVRAVGLSPDVGAADLYIVTGTSVDGPATLASVGYLSATDYAEVNAGAYRIIITVAGTKEILFQSLSQTLEQGARLTVAVFPSAGGRLVNAVLLREGDNGSGNLLPNPLGRIKAVNAIGDSPALNFKADGTPLLANVPFAGSSSYVTLATGARTVQIEPSNVPGSVAASAVHEVEAARDYTVLALDSIAAPHIAVVADDNTLPTSGYAKLRFVNALSGTSSVDILVDFASRATGVGFGSASAYSQLTPGSTYTITFATPGGVTVIATLADAELLSGGVYTALLMGGAGGVQARLVRDR